MEKAPCWWVVGSWRTMRNGRRGSGGLGALPSAGGHSFFLLVFAGVPQASGRRRLRVRLMNRRIEPLKPILAAHLFPKIDGMLIELLRSLAPADWEKQTVSPRWKVKDVAAHLLDTSLRGVSIGRDGYLAKSPRI